MSLWDDERVERYIRLYQDPRKKIGPQSDLNSDIASMLVGGSVADFGCGIGHLAAYIEDRKYLGIDSSEKMLEKAREFFPDKKFVQADVTNTDLLRALPTFNNTVAVSLALHLNREEAMALYRTMWEHTSPGGTMIFCMETNHNFEGVRTKKEGAFLDRGKIYMRSQLLEEVVEDVRTVTGVRVNWIDQKWMIKISDADFHEAQGKEIGPDVHIHIYLLSRKVNTSSNLKLPRVARTTILWVDKP